MCLVVLKKCCGMFTTLALAILQRSLRVAQFRDSIILVSLLPHSGLFSKQKFSHKKQNLNFERF